MNNEPNLAAATIVLLALGEDPVVARTVLATSLRLCLGVANSQLHVVHVVDVLPGAEGAIRSPDGEYAGAAALRAAAEERLAAAVRAAEDTFARPVRAHLEFGRPGAQVIEVATRIQPDFVVLGAVDHPVWERILFGSTADHVLRHAPCSVVLARQKGD